MQREPRLPALRIAATVGEDAEVALALVSSYYALVRYSRTCVQRVSLKLRHFAQKRPS
jgi:hypothetical protein